MDALLYSALTLRTSGVVCDPTEAFPLDARLPSQVFKGNHIGNFPADRSNKFDYAQAGLGAAKIETYAVSRGLTIRGYRTGEKTADDEQSLRQVTHNLLAINSVSTEEERSSSNYLQLAYSKVYQKVDERVFLNLDIESVQPKFVLITKGVPVYSFVLYSDAITFLFWSNDPDLESRARTHFGTDFYLYRLPVHNDGICILQSKFLSTRYTFWVKTMWDKLKVMNALEAHISRRWMSPKGAPVNKLTGIDHPGIVQSTLGS